MAHQLNLVVPCAGRGQRFKDQGIQLPKQLVEVKGKKIIEWAISSLPCGQFIFVVHADQNKHFGLGAILKEIVPDCIIIETPEYTEGPLCTALLAEPYIDGKPLIVADSDFYTKWKYDEMLAHMYVFGLDTCSLFEYSASPKNSYVILKDRYIVRAAEKEVISNISPHGIHYFRNGSIFVHGARRLISKNIRYNGEFYLSPLLEELHHMGYRCGVYKSSEHYPLGIPSDIKAFENVQL